MNMVLKRKREIQEQRLGFTLVDLLVIIAVIVVLLGLLLPSMRGGRGAARRMSCSNNFKQLGLAMHNYHSSYKHLPSAMAGTQTNANRLSGLVALLPFYEQQGLWETISNPSDMESGGNLVQFPAMGPEPWNTQYEPWLTDIPALRCPSDTGLGERFGRTNFAFSIGDTARGIHDPAGTRGAFACQKTYRFRDILDGLSNTIAMGEIVTDLGDHGASSQFQINGDAIVLESPISCCDLVETDRPAFFRRDVSLSENGRGGCWADGAAGHGLFNTILPPNSPNVAIGGSIAVDGIYNAASRHQGGCHILMGDGAVIFITDRIECGDSSAPTPLQIDVPTGASPYGLWGALGTKAMKEDVEEELNQ